MKNCDCVLSADEPLFIIWLHQVALLVEGLTVTCAFRPLFQTGAIQWLHLAITCANSPPTVTWSWFKYCFILIGAHEYLTSPFSNWAPPTLHQWQEHSLAYLIIITFMWLKHHVKVSSFKLFFTHWFHVVVSVLCCVVFYTMWIYWSSPSLLERHSANRGNRMCWW